MRLFLVCFLAVAACVNPTAPRDFHCFYVGDTVGVIAFNDTNNVITSCTFIVQKVHECNDTIDSRRLFKASDCIVGTKA
jgi:hypothetical protein